MNQSIVFDVLKKNTLTIWLGVIIVSGFVLRLHNLHLHYFGLLGFDEARDLLVARHQVEYGEWLIRGPDAFGGMGALRNSAGYYYALSLIWLLTGSVERFYLFWLVMMSSLIIIAFKVGQQFFSSRVGLILALLVSLTPEFVFESKNIYQPYLLPLCVFLFLFFVGRRSQLTINHTLAVFFLLLPLHFHYGILLIIPAATLWLAWEHWQVRPNHKNIAWLLWLVPVMVFFIMVMAWVWLTYTDYPFDQLTFLRMTASNASNLNVVSTLSTLGVEFGRSLWKVGHLGVTISSLLMLTPIAAFTYKNESNTHRKKRTLFLFSILGSVLFAALLQARLYEIYLLAVLPIYFLLLATSLNQLWLNHNSIGISLTFLIVVLSLHLFFKEEAAVAWHGSRYDELHTMASIIKTDLKNNSDFSVALLSPDGTYFHEGWGTTGMWYILESMLKLKLVELSEEQSAANFRPLESSPDILYFLCDHRYDDKQESGELCISKLKQDRLIFDGDEVVLYESPTMTLWKLSIDRARGEFSYRYY